MNRRKQKIVERRKAKEEAARLEAMKAKVRTIILLAVRIPLTFAIAFSQMGARRTERMKRKAGRTKKINH